ncbi:MAG: HPF/RaiA family ribosome-associated protein [Fimbriimonadaceae bacterium]|nr:HPF/RaiA family ribosome-associated protein [Fimbriimonadaceae bacterium]
MRLVVRSVGAPPSKRENDYAEKKFQRLSRLAGPVDNAEIVYREEKVGRRVDLVFQAAGRVHRATARDVDPLKAVDVVMDKVQAQLRKAHGRLTDHAPARGKREIADQPLGDHVLPGEAGHVVHTKTVSLRPMTLSEATLAFEASKLPMFPFHNVETSLPEVVYRRDTGGLGVMRLR